MIIYYLAAKGWSKLIWGSHSCVHSPNSAKCFLGGRQCARPWWYEGEQTDGLCLHDAYSSTGQGKKSQIISPLQTTINAVKEDYTEDHHRVNWTTFREGMNGAAGGLGGGGCPLAGYLYQERRRSLVKEAETKAALPTPPGRDHHGCQEEVVSTQLGSSTEQTWREKQHYAGIHSSARSVATCLQGWHQLYPSCNNGQFQQETVIAWWWRTRVFMCGFFCFFLLIFGSSTRHVAS